MSNYVNRADKDKTFSGNSSIFKWKKPQDIQLEESQILWTLKALHVILKFHIEMDDSIHQQAEETFNNNNNNNNNNK